MIVREFLTRLGFKVDMTGARQYDAALQRIRRSVQGLSQSLGSLPRNISINVSHGTAGVHQYGAALQNVQNIVNGLSKSLGNLPRNISVNLPRNLQQIGAAGHSAAGGLRAAGHAGNVFHQGALGFLNAFGEFGENIEELGETFAILGIAILAIPLAGDRMIRNIAAINSELQDTEQSEEVYEQLYQTVRRTGAGINEAARYFGNFHNVISDAGGGVDDTIGLMAGLQVAMANASMTAEEMNPVMDRIGKALEEGKFGKANFAALLDVPQLSEHLQGVFNVTRAGLRKLIVDNKLSTKELLAPLQDFARKWRDEINNLPPLLSRDWRGFVISIEHFAAEIDKAFKISESLARALRAISNMLERWRAHIATVREFFASLGDANSSLEAMAVVLGVIAVRSVMLAQMARWAGLLALKLFAAAAAFLLIEDFFAWIQGKDSLIGDVAGPFDEAAASVGKRFEELAPTLTAVIRAVVQELRELYALAQSGNFLSFEGSAAEIERILVLLRQAKAYIAADDKKFLSLEGSIAELERVLRLLYTIGYYVAGGFKLAWDGIAAAITAAANAAKTLYDVLNRIMTSGAGQSTALGPAGNSIMEGLLRRLGRMGGAGATTPGTDLLPKVEPGAAIGPSSLNTPPVQNNDINIQVPVTSTGGSGAEVAAGARSGVAAAARDMVADLGSVARGLSMSMPRAETAAA